MPPLSPAVELQARLNRREREFEAARRVTEAVGQASSIDDIMTAAVSIAVEVVDGKAGSVILADPAREQLVFRVSVGENPVKPGTSIAWRQGIAGEVFWSGEARLVRDIAQDPKHFSGIDALTGFKTMNMFALPLKSRSGQQIGVMEVLNRSGGPEEEDMAVLTIISQLTAIAVEQARLFEEAKLAEVVHRLREVSHDVKNMLMPVTIGVDLLHEELVYMQTPGKPLRPEAIEAVQMVKDAVVRIQSRVRIITEYMTDRQLLAQFAPCALGGIVTEVLDTLRLVATERQVTLKAEVSRDLPPLMADASRLYTALYNLVDNALPETPAGGFITLRARPDPDGEFILIEVEDTGRGMLPEVTEALFTGRVRSRKQGGTGLGTMIVHDVVHAHGGRITVRSEPGRGTCFSIRLPVGTKNVKISEEPARNG